MCALLATPAMASALVPESTPGQPAGAAEAAAGSALPVAEEVGDAVVTALRVALPVVGSKTVYVLGQPSPVSATVTWDPGARSEALAGEVEFFDGESSLGIAAVSGTGGSATATLETAAWPAAGLRRVSAEFRPAEAGTFAGSRSAGQEYRIVDTARMVPDIALGAETAAEIDGATLEWTVANIWFSNFAVGFEREVVSGPVTLPEMSMGSTIPEKQAYFFRPFTFSEGVGAKDSAGNRVISYEGAVRLTSGSANQWDFADPQVHIAPNGDGYITAQFSGGYQLGTQEYPISPTRVTVATFTGAHLETGDAGRVAATIELNWAGQAGAPGTWAHDYEDSFPTEFVALLHPAINLFFAKSSVATDNTKIPHPVTLTFTETAEVPEETKPPVVPPAKKLPFTDMKKGDKFYKEIAWMYESKLSTGSRQPNGSVKYLPKQKLSREAMAAFLYRMEGSKYVGPKVSPFADVKPGDKFYNEITWMYKEKISTGTKQATGKPKFMPKSSMSREAMAAFMYRLEGSKAGAPKTSPFVDMKKGDKFYKEIVWMFDSGLSTGNKRPSGKPAYLPKDSVTREAMAAFLYRLAAGSGR